jgi:DNA-binding CsgD family transcriptional regulator
MSTPGLVLDQIMDKLATHKIHYLALNVSEKNKIITTTSTNQGWINYCRNKYGLDGRANPVQKYVIEAKTRLVNLESLDLEPAERAYIQERNDFLEVRALITLLFRNQERLTTITLGTKQKSAHLLDFLNRHSSFNDEEIGQITIQSDNGLVILTKRESDCIRFLAQGKSMKESAKLLKLSPRTVESYINNVKNKTGFNYKSELLNGILR